MAVVAIDFRDISTYTVHTEITESIINECIV